MDLATFVIYKINVVHLLIMTYVSFLTMTTNVIGYGNSYTI